VKQPNFTDFKAAIDGKAATIILTQSRSEKRRLEKAIAEKRITNDAEVRRILQFCGYLEDKIGLPFDLSTEDWKFYKRTMEKLVERKAMPSYALAEFEEPVAR
jgi:hypothetical protein